MRQVALLVLVVACKAADDYPVDPNSDPHNPKTVDAPVATDGTMTTVDASNTLAGRVCLIVDPRAQTACKATGASGFTVKLGTAMATTAADGSFTIAKPTGTSPIWRISGTGLQPSVIPFGAATQLPAILASDYGTLQDNNGVSLQDGTEGEIFVNVVHAGAPLAKVRATSSPAPTFGVLYDAANGWLVNASNGTGAAGMLWFPATGIGLATLSITPMGASAIAVPNVPVETQAITWIVVDVP